MNLPLRTLALTAALSATLLVTGCAQYNYARPPFPPPPPYGGAPPLIQRADHEGFRMRMDDGARDAYNGSSYHPKSDRKFHDTPGYGPPTSPTVIASASRISVATRKTSTAANQSTARWSQSPMVQWVPPLHALHNRRAEKQYYGA